MVLRRWVEEALYGGFAERVVEGGMLERREVRTGVGLVVFCPAPW